MLTQQLDIATLLKTRRRYDNVARARVDLFLTPEVVQGILETVGSHPPETGSKLFGPKDLGGADVIEMDERGSASASAAMYAPDTEWGDERMSFWLNQPEEHVRAWHGDVHSHPGDLGFPSAASGPGKGDLGYAAAVFEHNEAMQDYFLPIITGSGSDSCTLWPWVVSRDQPSEPRFAEVHICSIEEFPPRRFNPAWEDGLAEKKEKPASDTNEDVFDTTPHILVVNLDLDEVASSLRAKLDVRDQDFVFSKDEQRVALHLPKKTVNRLEKPHLWILAEDGARHPFLFRWQDKSPYRLEVRLGRLLDKLFQHMQEEY